MKMERIVLEGSIPSPANPPKGCKFHTRCKVCKEKGMRVCEQIQPPYKEIEPGHFTSCHLYDTDEETNEFERLLKELDRKEALKANK